MSQPYVCATCRLRASIQSRLRLHSQRRQWLSRTTSVKQNTFNGSSDHDAYRGRSSRTPTNTDSYTYRRQDRPTETGPRGRYSGQTLQPQRILDELDGPPHKERRSPRQPLDTDVADSINRSRYGREQHPRADSRPNPTDLPTPLWKFRGKILNAGEADLEDSTGVWADLRAILDDETAVASMHKLSNVRLFRDNFFKWTSNVCDQWLQDLPSKLRKSEAVIGQPSSTSSPSPLQALALLSRLNLSFRATAAKTLWLGTREVLEFHEADPEAFQSPQNPAMKTIRELMGIWNLCMARELQHQYVAPVPQSSNNGAAVPPPLTWSFLPEPALVAETLRRQAQSTSNARSVDDAMDLLVGRLTEPRSWSEYRKPKRTQQYDYASAAIIMLDVLQAIRSQSGGQQLVYDFQPWITLMESAVQHATDRRVPARLGEQIRGAPSETIKAQCLSILERFNLDHVAEQASVQKPHDQARAEKVGIHGVTADLTGAVQGQFSAASSELQEQAAPSEGATGNERFVYLAIKRLGRAIESQDINAAEGVRKDLLNFNSRNPNVQLPLALYEHLLLAFLSLRSIETSIDIWNRMIQAGHNPTRKTYTIVVRYSQHLKNVNAMEYFWNRMRQAGVQPDAHAWSARIFGLSRRGKSDYVLRALAEMGREWVAAAKAAYAEQVPASKRKGAPPVQLTDLLSKYEADINGVTRPNLPVMNAAVTGLAKGDDTLIPKVIAWGRTFGIEPDVITYNVLMNTAMRCGKPEEALMLLRRMQERNIEPNGDTWVVLLSAMFEGGFIDALEPHDQEARIMEFVRSLESETTAGIDSKGYALIIDRLLKRYDNPSAAQAVLTHMDSRGIEPTQYHYTILMTSYFQQTPPNFAAIESLWAHIQGSKSGYGAALGSVFYDRMIEGYAANHDSTGTAPMLSFLSRMESEGKKPSWRALECVARALAEAREWERLAQIVDTLRRRMREAGVGGTTFGQRGFWEFVISTGLLRHEGISDPNQIMEENTNRDASRRLQPL
ncbi:hypothetical protein LTR37_017918 [Vermiconidia calcicola]|uniref:Uncharacterized protein n=1 Tax=Vermiconidia calcicola TaxID=1690605 RepID=A0ACC3MK31_9PEZI|nr:hypothetical protein LTR37_017918 [Vermiconidia calcicola]